MTVSGTEAEVELRQALNGGEIVPYFQSLVRVRSGVLSGFEVLARWLHPVRGMVAPDSFIPLAQRAGCQFCLSRMWHELCLCTT
jgi:EAL domain-containing protein (putative c-di-GMP-specific phosphodiesterase class I)